MWPRAWVPTGTLQLQGYFQTLAHTCCGLCECLMEKFSRNEDDWATKLSLSNLEIGVRLLHCIPRPLTKTIWYNIYIYVVHYKTALPLPLTCGQNVTCYDRVLYIHASCKLLQTLSVIHLDITKKFEDTYLTLEELTMKGCHISVSVLNCTLLLY
jgi:hypothetical protein